MKVRLFFLGLMATMLITACGAPSASPSDAPVGGASPASRRASPDGVLRISTPFFSQPPDPAAGGGFNAIQFGFGETLLQLDPTFLPQPWLATAVTAISDTTWEITLRQDVLFHDGTPMDAAAVKASLERAITRIPAAKSLLTGAQIACTDAHTLRITTPAPMPILPNVLTEPAFVIVNAAAANAQGAAFTNKPVLTGMFKIESFQVDQEIVGVRNDQYWGEKPQAARLIATVQADATARFLALQSGQVDIAVDIRPENVSQIAHDPNLRAVPAAPVATMFMYLNHRHAPWNTLQGRQALAYALPERSGLVSAVLRGQGMPATGTFPPTVLDCPGLQSYGSDMEKAKALLADLGYTDANGDGMLEKDGQPLTMRIVSYPQRPALNPMAEIIQARLKELGIQVEIQVVEQINDALTNHPWDGGMYFNNMAATGDPFGSLIQFFKSDGDANRGAYVSAETDRRIEQLRTMAGRQQRRDLACQIVQQVIQDVAIIPLVYPNFTYGVSNQVVGFDHAHPYFLYFVQAQMGHM